VARTRAVREYPALTPAPEKHSPRSPTHRP
jgi:hypothetical protein